MGERRMIIRETWASHAALGSYRTTFNVDIRVFFIMGSDESNGPVMDNVRQEHIRHRDIIQGRFLDTYRNLTFKALFALKWATEYCSQADYVIRVSDDVFVNGYNLFDSLISLKPRLDPSNKAILGYLCEEGGVLVHRRPGQKWYVTKDEYPWDTYPSFITAHGFIMTKSVVKYLYNRAISKRFFWLDDVFVTGLVLLGTSDVKIIDLKDFIYVGPPFRTHAAEDSYKSSIFIHVIDRTLSVEYDWWSEVLVSRGLP